MDLCHSTDVDGVSILNPTKEALHELLESLEDEDILNAEHPDVSLTNDTRGWAISASPTGIVTLEDLNHSDAEVKFIKTERIDETMKLWTLLTEGKIEEILNQAWSTVSD